MTDKPIIFSGPMVRALLDGRKTQTRRVLKPQPTDRPAPNCHPLHTQRHNEPYLDSYCSEKRTPANPRGMSRDWHWWQVDDRPGPLACRAPCTPGDRLYVREAHALAPASAYRRSVGVEQAINPNDADRAALYRAGFDRSAGGIRWRPSIHMPRWASRLTLLVTDVRVQRLQEISEDDAMAEGIYRVDPTAEDLAAGCTEQDFVFHAPGVRQGWGATKDERQRDQWWPNAPGAFRLLWNSLHGPDAWDANPWVVAVSFDVIRANIDAIGERK